MKRLLLLALIWPVIVLSSSAQQPAPIVDALDGLDPIALIAGRESIGRQAHSTVHDGLRYLFESAEHLAMFEKSPAKYAVQNRGMCARMGAPVPADQSLYLVHEGRIYVFASDGCQAAFKQAPASFIAQDQVPPTADAASVARARALLDRAAEGFGGAALVDALTTLRMVTAGSRTMSDGTVVSEKTTTTVEWPGRLRQDVAMGTRSGQVVVTPEDAFRSLGSAPVALTSAQSEGLFAEVLRQPIWLVKLRRDSNVRIWSEGPNAVGMFVRGSRLTLSIDPQTNRVVELSLIARGRTGEFGTLTVRFDDYRGNGLVLPHRESSKFNGASSGPDKIYEAIEVNPTLPAGFFSRQGIRP